MTPIRIALSRMEGLLRDIVVDAIRNEPDMQIVGQVASGVDAEADAEADVDALLRNSTADVLIFDESAFAACGNTAPRTRRLLHDHQGLRVLVLSEGGRAAEFHWLAARSARCADVSPDGLVDFIRTSFDGSRGEGATR